MFYYLLEAGGESAFTGISAYAEYGLVGLLIGAIVYLFWFTLSKQSKITADLKGSLECHVVETREHFKYMEDTYDKYIKDFQREFERLYKTITEQNNKQIELLTKINENILKGK